MNKSIRAVERINLKDHKEFINIEGNYGGYQDWLFTEKLQGKFWANRACGVVAAGNIAYYLTKHHNKKLYNYKDLSIREFTLFLNQISKFIKPRIYGIPSISYMSENFKRFARSKDVILKANTIDMKLPNYIIISFIKKALRENYPIMMLTWNTKIKTLKYHWVTITGYFKDTYGNNFIITSNWGKRKIFKLDDWLNEMSIYKGLVYFK